MSLELHNQTPFSAAYFEQLNMRGELVAIVSVRGTFDLVEGAPLAISPVQEEFVWADVYAGDPKDGNLLKQADFIAYKPATDITVRGKTFAPGGEAAATWLCGVKVNDATGATLAEKLLRVHGPRFWRAPREQGQKNSSDCRLEEGRPVVAVPLQWTNAFGGKLTAGTSEAAGEYDMRNPSGPGMPVFSRDEEVFRAPLIEEPNDPMIDPQRLYIPQNLAPIPPAWRWRQQFAGAYDEHWKQTRYPLLPEDFDYAFYNCAHPDLIIKPWLNGDENLTLLNLNRDVSLFNVVLPGLSLEAREFGDGPNRSAPLRLDGVHFAVEEPSGQVAMTWRAGFVAREGVKGVRIKMARVTDLQSIERA